VPIEDQSPYGPIVEWVVYAKEPFAGQQPVLRYLSRYTHRVAILAIALAPLALGDALASKEPLQLDQLGLATHVHPTLAGSGSASLALLQPKRSFT